MFSSPLTIFSTCSRPVPNAPPAAPKDTEKKFDPGKATICAAVFSMIAVLGAAAINKLDFLLKDPQIDKVVLKQTEKYKQIMSGLDSDLKEAQAEKAALSETKLPAREKTQRLKQLDAAIDKTVAVKSTLPAQFQDYKEQLEAGDHLASLETQRIMNTALVDQHDSVRMSINGKSSTGKRPPARPLRLIQGHKSLIRVRNIGGKTLTASP